MSDPFADMVIEICGKIADDFHYLYGLDRDEVNSVAILEAYERKEWLEILAPEKRTWVTLAIQRAVNAYFRQDRARSLAETDAYHYDPEYVRLFLPFFFARQDWMNGPVNEDSEAEYPTAEAMDTAIDMRGGWKTLKDWQERVIITRHLTCRPTIDGGVDWEAIATECGYNSGKYAQSRYLDATREFTFNMNVNRDRRVKAYEGTGARQVMSIRSAHALLSRD